MFFIILTMNSIVTIAGFYNGTIYEENEAIKWIFNLDPPKIIALSFLVNIFYSSLYCLVWMISIIIANLINCNKLEVVSYLYPLIIFTLLMINLVNDLSIYVCGQSIIPINYQKYRELSLSSGIIYLVSFYFTLILFGKRKIKKTEISKNFSRE